MGSTVGSHYEIVEKIGEGGWGVVYKARDLHVPRFVALKFIFPHLLTSPQAVWRFQQEARAVSVLSHPNIVVLHDFDTDPDTGRIYLALEYLGGGTLRQLIEQQNRDGLPLNPFELLRCAIAIAAGLGHAHRRKIIHRDVKPSNVMFSEERNVKITDFGLAKSDTPGGVAEGGCTLGTVSYMSPEQARGLEVDQRTDIFSLGVVIYQMATGRLPFAAPSPHEVLQRIVAEPTPLLKEASHTDLPEELDRIVQRATAKQASERYQDIEELETALLACEHRLRTLSEHPTGPIPPLPVKPSRRRFVAAAASAAMAVAAVLGTLWFRASRPPAAAQPPAARLMAVIPFHCLGAEESNKSFCEGLANTLSTKFTQMESLQDRVRVVPYSEIRSERLSSVAEARKLFKVELALTGSVEFVGGIVRVTVNLVDAKKMVQLVSRRLDSPAASLVRLQDETSDLAGGMLELRLTEANRQRLNAGQTRNEAAFASFVRGVGYLSGADRNDLEDLRRATELLEEAIRVDPSYALAHAHLGEAYLRRYQGTGDSRWIEQARESCERAMQLDGRLAQPHITLANVWLERTDLEKAAQEASAALNLEPRNADALRALGNAYAGFGRRDPAKRKQAIDTLSEAVALRPELWTTYRDLGRAYYSMGEYQKAEQQYLLMLGLTQSADAYDRVGVLYYAMGRHDDAIAYLQKSLAVKPTPEAYANLGTVCYYLQRYAEMIPNFENAIRLSERLRTTNHAIWGNLAMAYTRTPGLETKGQDAYRQAIRIAEAKLQVSPQDAATHASLAYYQVRVGDTAGASRHVKEALQLAPDTASVLFRCGLVYERLKRRDEALEAVKRAIDRGHPMKEVLNAGDLAALRQDPRFQEVVRK